MLNDVCNHILEIADLKLSCFKGNLAAFVKVRPEARAYFELKSNKLKFHFPKPGPIEGESASLLNFNMAKTPSPWRREAVHAAPLAASSARSVFVSWTRLATSSVLAASRLLGLLDELLRHLEQPVEHFRAHPHHFRVLVATALHSAARARHERRMRGPFSIG